MPQMVKFTVKDVMPKILELKDMVLDVDPDFYNVVTCKFEFLRNHIPFEFFWNPSHTS